VHDEAPRAAIFKGNARKSSRSMLISTDPI
jgi:hypothetical protein